MAISPLQPNQNSVNQLLEKSQSVNAVNSYKSGLDVSSGTATKSVSLAAKQQPMDLLYKAAIDKINEQLEQRLGPKALESAYKAGIDVSPEATSQRIVNISLAFYSSFKENHKGEDEYAVRQSFIEILRSGVDKGFAEAREILDGLGVLEGEIAENINRTYDLVQQGYDNFLNPPGDSSVAD